MCHMRSTTEILFQQITQRSLVGTWGDRSTNPVPTCHAASQGASSYAIWYNPSPSSLAQYIVQKWIDFWLVVDLPLWKIWVRQLGWLFPIYGEKCSKLPTRFIYKYHEIKNDYHPPSSKTKLACDRCILGHWLAGYPIGWGWWLGPGWRDHPGHRSRRWIGWDIFMGNLG